MKTSTNVNRIIEGMSIKCNNKVYELLNKGKDIIRLSYGEAYFKIPLYSFDNLPFPNIYHYSHSRGILELRKILSNLYQTDYDVNVNPESEIIITTGAKSAILIALLSILNSGDEVLIWEPQWVSYSEIVILCNATPVMIPLEKSINNFEKFLTKKTKCIILNNPNNPRSINHTYDEIEILINLAIEHNIYLLSDESYSEFVPENSKFISLGLIDKKFKNSIITNSLSKNFGISGWRIGYVITNSETMNQILKVQQHLVTCPSTILEYYLITHFTEIYEICKTQIKEITKIRNDYKNYLSSIGIESLDGDSTFYVFINLGNSKLGSEIFSHKLLLEKDVSTVPGIGYGKSCDHFIRLSVGVEPWERLVIGAKKILELIEETSNI